MPSLTTPANQWWRTPAARRAETSHRTVISPKTTRKYSPDHFVAAHNPRLMPATQRQGRSPSEGPSQFGSRPRSSGIRWASRARVRSRSSSSAPNAASAKNITLMSSRPVRECTKWCPSTASSSAAMVPSCEEDSNRRAIRPTMTMDRMPSTHMDKRQPTELSGPSRLMPAAMTHLPTGPCTAMSPTSGLKTSRVPCVKALSISVP